MIIQNGDSLDIPNLDYLKISDFTQVLLTGGNLAMPTIQLVQINGIMLLHQDPVEQLKLFVDGN